MTTLEEQPSTDRSPGFARSLRYEWAAFRSLRSNWALMGSAVVVHLLLTIVAHDSHDTGDITFNKVMSVAWLFTVLVGALGVNAFGTEYRYRTIVTTMLTARSRTHVLLAKAVVVTAAAIVAECAALASSWLVLAGMFGAAPTVSTSLVQGAGAVVYAVLVTLIGLGLAVLLHGSITPIALLVVWPQIEMFLINRLDLPEWLLFVLHPFYSARQLISDSPAWPGTLPMLGLAAVLLGASAVVLNRRDV
ncbi:ABC transporter permease [Saccharopolyspora flava]|uniref:ABC-2 family transporter protein n=1 Tax=Saccharopolyspora flava TaxID=95161 RepID=A0A1I6QF06_9PSEU|nr:ABC transporter permease [Saccharopolyspora flava]SFS51056.1 ABC-2 family transporter protein [Saccharopolyspora flava]